ncbi:molecular chaperone GrpE [Flavonifractor plautii]|nr:molecular chaperone GrpE [Flavonifractor plautii]MBM6885748.1 molecular chaperone GrpE [Pseudoflavonifractor phocaeensis]
MVPFAQLRKGVERMAYLILGIVMIFLSIVFRLAAVFRLTIPLVYALIVPTVFHEWYYANQTLANVIWYALLAVVVLSWVVSLVRKVRGILLRRREDKMLELIVRNRMREAQMYGEPEPDGGYKIQVDDLFEDD